MSPTVALEGDPVLGSWPPLARPSFGLDMRGTLGPWRDHVPAAWLARLPREEPAAWRERAQAVAEGIQRWLADHLPPGALAPSRKGGSGPSCGRPQNAEL